MLPLELWLIVFKYTDGGTFKKIMMCLFEYDKVFTTELFSLVCNDIIKTNEKIVMMNNLMLNPTYYRKKRTYIDFVIDYENASTEEDHAAEAYRHFIYQNREICFDNARDGTLFKNLTSGHTAFDGLMGVTETTEHCEFLYYYKQKIPIRNIVKLLLDRARVISK